MAEWRCTASSRARPGAKVGDQVNLAGVECTVVSDEQAELAEMAVCVGLTVPLAHPDNQTGPCAGCGDPLQWRPHAPKRPPKTCVRCAEIRILAETSRRPDA